MYIHIYLKKSEELEEITTNHSGTVRKFQGRDVFDYDSAPFLKGNRDIVILNQDVSLKKFFLKATCWIGLDIRSLNGSKICFRQHGEYRLGDAIGILTPTSKTGPYQLEMETYSWEGIADMEALKKKIWAGTISPYIVYGKDQTLTICQRFLLAPGNNE
ncbi:MAG: hypothetical protein ACI9AR_000256 [Flavobacteriaceae bacterium]|jgi:hypothetical protein